MCAKTHISRSQRFVLKGAALRRVGAYWQDMKRMGLDEATVRRALKDAEQDEKERARREKRRAS